MRRQLLCTFVHKRDIEIVRDYISEKYDLINSRIHCFQNSEDSQDCYLTYNISSDSSIVKNTIPIHRKKETNTLYTINALNCIIRKMNNGVFDPEIKLNWELYQNTLLLSGTTNEEVLKINLFKI